MRVQHERDHNSIKRPGALGLTEGAEAQLLSVCDLLKKMFVSAKLLEKSSA